MPIRLLSPDVSSKIAAGEVIERPASVVKELVENSLDAEATEISVEVRGGGVEFIRVSDNGGGIASGDVELAFQRFATSKVAVIQDLEAISTLGFRGEALPSIAVAASVSLLTRSADEELGTRLELVGGKIARKESQGVSTGTSVTVRHLFRDFPARRKFLRSTATETSRMQTLVTRYALAYPEVRFQLTVEGSTGFSSPGSGELRDVIAAVYSLEIAQAMLELSQRPDAEDGLPPLSISGLISPPSVDRANRSYISLFVNRRWIQSRALGYALEQAYHGFLAERRYPLAMINIILAADDVDVNVHPAKAEVRFRRENQVFAALQRAVRRALTVHSPVPEIGHDGVTRTSAGAGQPRTGPFWPVAPFAQPTVPSPIHDHPSDAPARPRTTDAGPLVPRKALLALRVLGQVDNTYVVAEGPDGVYLIDQHAAHERVVFERVRADAITRTPRVQTLLEPATVELNPEQRELVETHRELLSRMGLQLEPFGGSTYLLRGVPDSLVRGDPGQALLDVLDTMAEGGGFESWEERGAYSVACHGSIRAGKTLSHQEMSELTRQLEECQQPNTCPHGRPTMIHLSSSHLEREFGRR